MYVYYKTFWGKINILNDYGKMAEIVIAIFVVN